MIENFFPVAQQVLVLFIFVLCGYVLGKTKLLDEAGVRTCSNIVLYVATPSLIISSYIREFSIDLLGELLLSILIAFLLHLVSIIAAHTIFRKDYDDTLRLRRFSIVFSNAGYMGLPLQVALLGNMGVFLGASYVAVFNILVWTYGIYIMSKDKGSFSAKKLINPGLISVIIGLIIFVFSVPVPSVINSALSGLASLNTPVPMIIVGYFMSKCNIKKLFTSKICYSIGVLRLIILPLTCLLGMYFFGVRGDMLVSMTIAASTPVAAITSIFAVLYKADSKISVNLISFTTLVSIITMPVIVSLAQFLA